MNCPRLSAMIFATLFVLCCLTASSPAQVDPVTKALEALDQALAHDAGLAPETREALRSVSLALRDERESRRAFVGGLESEVAALLNQATTGTDYRARKRASDSLFQHLRIHGDFRFRHESSFDLGASSDRHRQRIRFRLGLDFKISDEVTIESRLVTGDSDDPNSPHQSLGTVFNKMEASFDRINLTYRPDWLPGLKVRLGKFGHAFQANPVYGELVWDGDVQPEGLAVQYRHDIQGEFLEWIEGQVGLYDVLEQGGGEEAFAFVAQLAARLRLGEDLTLDLAAAYYYWTDPTPNGNRAGAFADNAGNALVDRDGDGFADDFLSDFGIVNAFAGLVYRGWDLPITFSVEVIWNSRAEGDQDLGWSLGLAVGEAKAAGDWRFYYGYAVVQQDAVFSPVAQDDFLFQTNHDSHMLGVNTMLSDAIGLHLWALISSPESGGNSSDPFRIRLDLNVRF